MWRIAKHVRLPSVTAGPILSMQRARPCGSGFDVDMSVPVQPPVSARPTLEQPRSGAPDGKGGVVIGNTAVGVRDNLPYVFRQSRFIGKFFPALRPRTSAGDVLALIDSNSGSAVLSYLTDSPNITGHFNKAVGTSFATVSFNSFTFPQPVYEGDLIRTESRVIFAGSSSIAVHCLVERQAFDSPVPSYVGEAYVTFVTVDAEDITKPKSGCFPAVRLSSQADVERSAAYNVIKEQSTFARQRVQAMKSQREAPLDIAVIELPENRAKPRKQTIRQTTVVHYHCFTKADLNGNGAIFGGAILRIMEETALHCGRVFSQQPRIFTLVMLGMTFHAPMYVSDMARCRARVLCVRKSTMLVRVEIAAEGEHHRHLTNSADFILVRVETNGVPAEIGCGIDLEASSPEEQHWYQRARTLLEQSAASRVVIDQASHQHSRQDEARTHEKASLSQC